MFVWYPFSSEYQAALTPNEQLAPELRVVGDDHSRALRCGTVSGEVVSQLEEIPKRPVWKSEATDDDDDSSESRSRSDLENEWTAWSSSRNAKTLEEKEKVVKIASGLDFVLALKGNSEVWFRKLGEGPVTSTWEYVS